MSHCWLKNDDISSKNGLLQWSHNVILIRIMSHYWLKKDELSIKKVLLQRSQFAVFYKTKRDIKKRFITKAIILKNLINFIDSHTFYLKFM